MFKFWQGDPVCAVQCTSLHGRCVLFYCEVHIDLQYLRVLHAGVMLMLYGRCSCKILSTYRYMSRTVYRERLKRLRGSLTDRQAGDRLACSRQAGRQAGSKQNGIVHSSRQEDGNRKICSRQAVRVRLAVAGSRRRKTTGWLGTGRQTTGK